MLSLVLPTYNEADNLPDLLEEAHAALEEVPHEIIVVDDDSPDRTWEVAELIAENDPSVRVLRRVGKKGLASAVVEGFRMAGGTVFAVMDSDGQHDPALLPKLYDAVRSGAAVAVGSRYIAGGSVEGWAKPRHAMSVVATSLSWLVCSTRISDPMSGFFAMDAAMFGLIGSKLQPRGFKILFEILACLPRGSRVVELPLVFRLRRAGQSKLSMLVEWEFLRQVGSLFLKKRGWVIFMLVAIVILFFISPKVWALRLLYLDSDVRGSVRQTMEAATDREGWLMSDISIKTVTKTSVRIVHRQHRKGEDSERCLVLPFDGSSALPCED